MNNPKTAPKDFFLHLGAAIALYAAAGALIDLAFSIVNYLNPDVLAGYFYGNSVAWPISMLVILVPVLYGLEWLISRDIARDPSRKDIWVRRWRIYLTLFLAAALIGGDLIALLNTYFNGEITARFVYKVLIIIFVAGAVGKHYFYTLNDSWKRAKFARTYTAWVSLAMVVAAIVGGFLIFGSPAHQRAIRFDNQRVNDLTSIQWQVISYWQQKGALPSAPGDLNDSISGYSSPVDPATGAAYEYSVKGKNAFELCASFSEESQDSAGRGAYGSGGGAIPYATDGSYAYPGAAADSWAHPAGHACFERTIDPARYPVTKSPLQ